MKDDFYKFPSTPHLALLGEVTVRDDKVMSEFERGEFLKHELVVEEKVDGANLGISFDESGNILAQNRGGYLQFHYLGQWKNLSSWLAPKTDELFEQLTDQYIIFGEWCYAQHSVIYDRLPDWFLGFDIFDKKDQMFFSCRRRDEMFRRLGIVSVPFLGRGHYSLNKLKGFLSKSRLSEGPAEGAYLRFDKGNWLTQRAKLVRPEFIQTIGEHWSRKRIHPQRLGWEANR